MAINEPEWWVRAQETGYSYGSIASRRKPHARFCADSGGWVVSDDYSIGGGKTIEQAWHMWKLKDTIRSWRNSNNQNCLRVVR